MIILLICHQNPLNHLKFDVSSLLLCLPDSYLALFQEMFTGMRDYKEYKYVFQGTIRKPDGCSCVTFQNLSLKPGKYRLFYVSEYKDTLLGISDVFQVSICVPLKTFKI